MIRCCLFISIILFSCSTVFSQEKNFNQELLSTLASLSKSIESYKQNINQLQKQYDKTKNSVQKQEYKQAIEEKSKQLKNAQDSFFVISSNIHIEDKKTDQSGEKKNLLDELQDLLTPMIQGLKKISEKPRKIEDLKNQIQELKFHSDELFNGSKRVRAILKSVEDKELKQKLIHVNKEIIDGQKETKIELEEKESRLALLMQDKDGILSSASIALRDFISTKGRNISISLLVFILILWGLLYLKKYFFKIIFYNQKIDWLKKSFNGVYNLATALLAFSGAVSSLYLLNDWVLVTVTLIVFSALLWSLKNYAPKFITEAKTIFNLGAVREGERVLWKDLPWRIESLGVYSILVNPRLQGGRFRVQIGELIPLQSRPMDPHEHLFPSKVGDWIELSNGEFGQVLLQTPEHVLIHTKKNEKRYYKTSDFLSLMPINLSDGFGIITVFGIDYRHQQLVTTEVIQKVKQELPQLFSLPMIPKAAFEDMLVEFESAAESSLNLWIKLSFPGEFACFKLKIKREIQRCLVEICNNNQYVIPFNQLSVHVENMPKQ